MSLLAHATYGAPGFEAEKRALDATIQAEIHEAKRIQAQTGCSWGEALRLAAGRAAPLSILPAAGWACDDCKADYEAGANVWREVGPDFYEKMRGCVPPICLGAALPGFLVGEPYTYDHELGCEVHLALVFHRQTRRQFARHLPRKAVREPVQALLDHLTAEGAA